jgi:hypothetical protein
MLFHGQALMKLLAIILIAIVGFSTSSFAAKTDGKAAKRGVFRKTFKAYDRNRNRQIDGAEIEALKNAYATFKRIDSDADGTLGDDEIKALNAKAGAEKGKVRKANAEAGKPKARKAKGKAAKTGKKKREKAR